MTPAPLPDALVDSVFGLSRHSYIFLIGGGGKTTLMFLLANHLVGTGRTVISTTSTKILYPTPADTTQVIIEDDFARLVTRLRSEVPAARHAVLGKTLCDDNRKLSGFLPEELDRLRLAHVADCILVEADGAAGRSLKAHLAHEPVVSADADLVIALIGSDCIGSPLDEVHVHRAAHFGRLLDRKLGTPITAEDVAAILLHPRGYLSSVASQTEVIVLISKVRAAAQRANAARLAQALRAADRGSRVARIALGELAPAQAFLELAG